MKKLLLILAVTLGLICNQSAAVTIAEYEKFAETDKDGADLYISGIAAGIRASHLAGQYINKDMPHLDQFCRPEGVRLGGNLAKVALQTYKDAQTQKGEDSNLGFAILVGLIIMFPCYD